MNIYRYVYKLSPSSADKVISQSTSASLPDGYFTDGEGNIYKIPTTGKTSLFTVDDIHEDIKFSYDWAKGELNIYVRQPDDEIETNNYAWVTSYSVNAENFVDGPDYWCKMALQELDDDVENELQFAEAYELYGEIIDDDKENYQYEIDFSFELLNDMPDTVNSGWDIDKYYNQLEKFLVNYDIKTKLYDQELKVKAQPDENNMYLSLIVDFPMPLTKEELMDIWNNYEEYITDAGDEFGYVLTLNIEEMYEV